MEKMKICAVVCEYNPFHNGHLYQLGEMKKRSGCEKLLCLMSGNFTQRGEAAVFDKYMRARHAVECGADAVLELPAAFAVAPAEIFAQGAVKLLSAIPAVKTLAFGCESGTKDDFLKTALATLREDRAFKAALKEHLKGGTSYVRARTQALLSLHADLDEKLLSSPNNILGVEYCRALLANKAAIEPLPILRIGAMYADMVPRKEFSSATSLRVAMADGTLAARRALKRNLPKNVYEDALNFHATAYEDVVLCALLRAEDASVASTPDCSEGLENRLKAMARTNPEYGPFLEKVVTKRYTRSRIKRILLQTFLRIGLDEVKDFLESPLYLRTLAIKKEGSEGMLSALSEAKYPLIVRKSDAAVLKKDALACFEKDRFAGALYGLLTHSPLGDYETLFV